MRFRSGRFALLILCGWLGAADVDLAAAGERSVPRPVFGSDALPQSAVGGSFEGLFAPADPISEPLEAIDADPQKESHPAPKHTGFGELVRKTGSDFNAFPRRRSTWVILGIGAAAAAIAYPFDDDLNEELQDSDKLDKFFIPGKYLGYGYVQMGTAVGLYLIGRYAVKSEDGRTNKYSHLGFDMLRAQILVQALTYGIKYSVQRDRPTGECCSFPSGHASVTFATASVLERHFGYRGAWPTFVIAGYVAASRLTDNKHFLSDVLFGSALGMASGWTVVGRHGRNDFTLYPVPTRGGVALAGVWTPGGNAGRSAGGS